MCLVIGWKNLLVVGPKCMNHVVLQKWLHENIKILKIGIAKLNYVASLHPYDPNYDWIRLDLFFLVEEVIWWCKTNKLQQPFKVTILPFSPSNVKTNKWIRTCITVVSVKVNLFCEFKMFESNIPKMSLSSNRRRWREWEKKRVCVWKKVRVRVCVCKKKREREREREKKKERVCVMREKVSVR